MKRKHKTRLLVLLMMIALTFGSICQLGTVEAASSDFVIQDGVLIDYTGNDTEIIIPEGVTVIGPNAFAGKNVTRVTLAKSVTTIAEEAFRGSSLRYIIFSDGGSLTTIERLAFSACDLSEISLPKTLAYLGSGVFVNCQDLQYVWIPRNITVDNMLPGPFEGCGMLSKVEFETGITTIPDCLFQRCPGLTVVELPDTVRAIGEAAFNDCDGLKVVKASKIVQIRKNAFRGCDNLYDIAFGNELMSIGEYAFMECRSLSIFNFSDTVTEIGTGAFSACAFREVALPKNLRTLGLSSFRNCILLNKLDIPEGITVSGYMDGWLHGPFNGCTNLRTIEFEEGSRKIPDYFFQGCSAINTIIIPDTVETIGSYAFSKCSSLIDIEIPSSVKTMGERCFEECDNLSHVIIPADSKLQTIGTRAFAECSRLYDICIPGMVETIGDGAFSNCDAISDIYIPDSVTSLGDSAFRSCDSLKAVCIGNGVSFMGAYCFEECKNLYSVVLPDKLPSIPAYAFQYCTSLKEINIPESVERIGYQAFLACSDLEIINLPEGLSSIDSYAFEACSKLQNLQFPKGLVSIGTEAFCGCTSFTKVSLEAVSKIGKSAFGGCSKLLKVQLGSEIKEIPESCFGNDSQLEMIILPPQVTSIGKEAFTGCTLLREIYIGNAVKSIGSNVFQYPKKLTIYAELDSYAESYAETNGITFVPIEHEHAWGHPTVIKQPTCYESGEKHYNCYGCADVYIEKIEPYSPITGHSWDNGLIKKAATESSTGEIVYTCKTCKVQRTEALKFVLITKQPNSIAATAGSGPVTFAIKATGDNLVYQWYWRKNYSSAWNTYGTAGSGKTSITVDATRERNGFQYYCQVRDDSGNRVNSVVATLNIKAPDVIITKQPVDITATDGSGNVTFSVAAEGVGLSYQWYWRKSYDSLWMTYGTAGSDKTSLSIGAIKARNGYQYYCEITSSDGVVVNSNEVVLTVQAPAPVITKQPVSVTAMDGSGNVTFSVAATGSKLTYQWYWRRNSSSAWIAYGTEGSDKASLSVGAITARNGFEYYCVVKDEYGNKINSNIATLTVKSAAITITKQPADVTAVNGSGNVTFTVAATGTGLTYQWFWRKNSTLAWSAYGTAGSDKTSLSVGAITARNGFQYYCKVTNSSGQTLDSNIATLTVSSAIVITKQPANVTAANGSGNVTFSVGATGNGLIYQWYWRRGGSTEWTAYGTAGSEKTSISIGAITARNGFEYYCKITDSTGNVISTNAATLTVK